MKFTIEKKELLDAVKSVSSVVERRNTVEILGNIKFEVKGSDLIIQATDSDIEVTRVLQAEDTQDGVTTVNAATFTEILGKLSGQSVSIELNERMIVKSGRSRFQLSVLDAGAFPDLSSGVSNDGFTINAKDFYNLINRIKFASSVEESRYVLNGVYLHTDGNSIIAVATDSHRLARGEYLMNDDCPVFDGVIIPTKAINVILKTLNDISGDIKIEVTKNKISFHFEGGVITSRLIDGQFPDYERIIPSNNGNELTIDCSEFKNSVSRISTISDVKSNSVKLTVSKNKVEVYARSPDGSDGVDDIEADCDFNIEIGFNAKYLLDTLSNVVSENVTFSIGEASKPVLIRDNNLLFLVMPLIV